MCTTRSRLHFGLVENVVVVRLLFPSKELHLKQRILFSDIIGHPRTSTCSTALAARPVPDGGLSRSRGYTET